MDIQNTFKNSDIIYEYAFIAFIVSMVFLLFILPIIIWIRSVRRSSYKGNSTVNPEEDIVGLTEIHEKGYDHEQKYEYVEPYDSGDSQEKPQYTYDSIYSRGYDSVDNGKEGYTKNNRVQNEHLHSLIDEVEGKTSNNNELSYLIKRFWDNEIPKLQSKVSLEKMLLLKKYNEKFTIERYSLFSIDLLEQIENNLNIPNPLFKKLIDKKKNLYLTGKITKSKTFNCMFLESEYRKYNQIYLFPINIDNKLKGVLLLVREVGAPPLSVRALKMIISKTSNIRPNLASKS